MSPKLLAALCGIHSYLSTPMHVKYDVHPLTKRNQASLVRIRFGCSFFAYSWKLPAYSGAFLLTVDNFSFLLTVGAFFLTVLASLLTVGAFFA